MTDMSSERFANFWYLSILIAECGGSHILLILKSITDTIAGYLQFWLIYDWQTVTENIKRQDFVTLPW